MKCTDWSFFWAAGGEAQEPGGQAGASKACQDEASPKAGAVPLVPKYP